MKITLNFMKKNASLIMLATMLSLIFIEPSFGGATDANSWNQSLTDFADKFSTALLSVGAAVITIAFMFAGYQIAFGGKSITALMPIIIGAVIIGGAAALATLLIPTAKG